MAVWYPNPVPNSSCVDPRQHRFEFHQGPRDRGRLHRDSRLKETPMLDRRRFLTVIGSAGTILAMKPAFAEAGLPKVIVSKDPSCGCCSGWVDHLKTAGFPVE